MSNSQRPHGRQPTRLLCPWDFPGKSTGVGCHCLLRSGPIFSCLGIRGLNQLGASFFSQSTAQRKADGLVCHTVTWFLFQDGAHVPRHRLQVLGKKREELRPRLKGPSQEVCSFLKSSPGSLICEFHSLARTVSPTTP